MWTCDESVDVWKCGSVEVWECGRVDVWTCGSVEMWKCGSVEAWKRGNVEGWNSGRRTYEKTRLKIAASEAYWRLPSSPIVGEELGDSVVANTGRI